MTYAVKCGSGFYLSVDEKWVDINTGIKEDCIRGYTEFESAMADASRLQAGVVAHPWPAGDQREMFPLWVELGPEGSMKEEVTINEVPTERIKISEQK